MFINNKANYACQIRIWYEEDPWPDYHIITIVFTKYLASLQAPESVSNMFFMLFSALRTLVTLRTKEEPPACGLRTMTWESRGWLYLILFKIWNKMSTHQLDMFGGESEKLLISKQETFVLD